MGEETMLWAIGWLGAALLWMAGFGLGESLSGDGRLTGGGLTGGLLLVALVGFAAGLILASYTAFHGSDFPLIVGVVGAVVASALGMFR